MTSAPARLRLAVRAALSALATLAARLRGGPGCPKRSAMALWGRLPAQPEVLRHRVDTPAVRAWQAWLERHGPTMTRPQPSRWSSLAPRRAEVADRPIAFLLPPGVLAFSGKQHVAGILSLDRRPTEPCSQALLIWRCVDSRWLATHAHRPGLPWWHAQAQLLERWLWLSQQQEEEAASPPGRALSALRLCALAERLDAAPPPDARTLEAWLERQLPEAAEEPTVVWADRRERPGSRRLSDQNGTGATDEMDEMCGKDERAGRAGRAEKDERAERDKRDKKDKKDEVNDLDQAWRMNEVNEVAQVRDVGEVEEAGELAQAYRPGIARGLRGPVGQAPLFFQQDGQGRTLAAASSLAELLHPPGRQRSPRAAA